MKHLAFILPALLLAIPSVATADEHEAHNHEHAEAEIPTKAVAVLVSKSESDVKGMIMLQQHKGYVHVTGEVKNLTPGKHGFHIHEFGDISSADGKSTGGHFNPADTDHGSPGQKSHVGDLGNITANEDGVAKVDIQAKGLMLHTVFGRAFVVHAGEDDLKSQPSGAAGARVAVGVIGVAKNN